MARYRLRFLLQEFDLPRGITIIGRSLDCHLTIEDPLVSRQHARIVIDDAGAYVEDMGSRNGVRVDGATIRGPTQLIDGMRIRIGTQDFLFCNVEIPGKAATKTTGVLRLCASCRMPYPREAPSCPNCEATEQTDEDTLTGVGPSEGAHSARAWSAQLLVEALDRFDGASIAAIASRAAAMSLATNNATWSLWVLDIYRRIGLVPPADVVERLAEVALEHRSLVLGAVTSLLEHLGARGGRPSQRSMEALTRLEQVRGLLSEGTSDESGVSSSSRHRLR